MSVGAESTCLFLRMPTCFITASQSPSNCPLPRFPDGSDPECAMCITVNHAGQPSNPKKMSDSINCQENACLRLMHQRYPRVCSVEYSCPCVRGKFSQMARGNRGLDGGQRIKNNNKMFPRARTVSHGPRENPARL
ncbi:hypothetical protein TNCV_4980581 [Trichonephila clavipes]|nr:hypothetical protein TNCV_4980581 [Trichonephila clavipes]